MEMIRKKLFKVIILSVSVLSLSVLNPVPGIFKGIEINAEQASQSIEEYQDKYVSKLNKVYKHYNKKFYTSKTFKKLTACYEEGVSAIRSCENAGAVRESFSEYKEKLYAIKPTKLVKFQEKLENRLLEAYDSLLSEYEYSEKGLSKMETLKEKGIENIYASNSKNKAGKVLDNVIEELTAFAASPEANRDVIEELEATRKKLIDNAAYYDSLDNSTNGTWCFKRMTDHSPSGTYEYFKITDYNGFYLNTNVSDDDKVIYLTFDCGYPSKLTEKILDTLAKHNAKASFFVTKMYLEECGDYARRMVAEGHAVCNHTVTHTDLTKKSVEKIASEIIDVAEYFYEITGTEFAPFFRTPTGAYTKRLMTIIKDAGYKTVFWSIAYGDYDEKNQPAPGYVTNHFKTYHHNGAVALMHNDSTSNANELDAVLTLLEKEGYRFGALSEIE